MRFVFGLNAFLCALNVPLWAFYTRMPVMATAWGVVAVGMLFWARHEANNR